jgi:phage terminase large subunit
MMKMMKINLKKSIFNKAYLPYL